MIHPLQPIVAKWQEKIRMALDYKKTHFQEDADEAMFFFDGPYDAMYSQSKSKDSKGFVYQGDDSDFPKPSFAMTVNKVAELVQLFGPALYHRNPVRQVNPRKPPQMPQEFLMMLPPQMQQQYGMVMQQAEQGRWTDAARAEVLQHYLNFTPTALNLQDHFRNMIEEALIKGMGIVWPEVYQPIGAPYRMVGSFFDTVDNLVIDPDAESKRDATWVARKCCHPVWRVEEEYKNPRGTLRGNLESMDRQAGVNTDKDGDYWRKQGQTNDLLVYWKIYSKMGIGNRLSGVKIRSEADAVMESLGKYCFLVIADEIPYPLNLPTSLIETATSDEEIKQRLEWPTPFWAEDGWPFSDLSFHTKPRQVWPISHMKPGMGELKFINWAMSFLAGKVKIACRDFVVIAKSAGEELKSIIQNGQDYTLIELEKAHGTISEVVQFLQHPGFNGDIYKVIEAVTENFEKRVGLTDLVFGMSSRQMRSASEAQVKSDQIQIRPDDMAQKTEVTATDVARKEALACRWHLKAQDVQQVMGKEGSYWWSQLVESSDPAEITHQLEYRIEAGSARKPNKERDAQNMKDAVQTLFQPLFTYAQATGNVNPLNALITDWAKSLDMDPSRYILSTPPPPEPTGKPTGQGQQTA